MDWVSDPVAAICYVLHRAIGIDYVGREWCVDWQPHGAERLLAVSCRADFVVSRRRILAGLLEAG